MMKFLISIVIIMALSKGCKNAEQSHSETPLIKTETSTADADTLVNDIKISPQNPSSVTDENEVPISDSNDTDTMNQASENITLEYKAISRGFYNEIVITKHSVSFQSDLQSKAVVKKCSTESWSKLMQSLNALDLNQISDLKAPTEKRLFDGAAGAQLKISANKMVYETQSFDHGAPPKPLEILVKQILSLTENIE